MFIKTILIGDILIFKCLSDIKTWQESSKYVFIKFHTMIPIAIQGKVFLRGIPKSDTKTNDKPDINIIILRVIQNGPRSDLAYFDFTSNQAISKLELNLFNKFILIF